MHPYINFEQVTVGFADADPALGPMVQALNLSHHPLLYSKLPHGPPDDLPWDPVESLFQVNKGQERCVARAYVLLLELSEDKYGISGSSPPHETELHARILLKIYNLNSCLCFIGGL